MPQARAERFAEDLKKGRSVVLITDTSQDSDSRFFQPNKTPIFVHFDLNVLKIKLNKVEILY